MRKLAHVRAPGYGSRTWSGARWFTPGPVQDVEILDAPELTVPSRVTKWTPNGTFVPVPTPCRPARLASFRMTNPAIFQSYFRTNWGELTGASANLTRNALSFGGTRAPMGRAEGQPLIPYDPFPASTDLYPKLGQF